LIGVGTTIKWVGKVWQSDNDHSLKFLIIFGKAPMNRKTLIEILFYAVCSRNVQKF